MQEYKVVSNSTQETIELGKKIGEQLQGGEIFCFIGTLGSGKTHFIKGITAGAMADEEGANVNSPTFVLVNEYHGKFDIYHIDAYRLESVEEFERIGFDDFCYPGSVVLIEWADRVLKALNEEDCIIIELSHEGHDKRQLHFKNLPHYISI